MPQRPAQKPATRISAPQRPEGRSACRSPAACNCRSQPVGKLFPRWTFHSFIRLSSRCPSSSSKTYTSTSFVIFRNPLTLLSAVLLLYSTRISGYVWRASDTWNVCDLTGHSLSVPNLRHATRTIEIQTTHASLLDLRLQTQPTRTNLLGTRHSGAYPSSQLTMGIFEKLQARMSSLLHIPHVSRTCN